MEHSFNKSTTASECCDDNQGHFDNWAPTMDELDAFEREGDEAKEALASKLAVILLMECEARIDDWLERELMPRLALVSSLEEGSKVVEDGPDDGGVDSKLAVISLALIKVDADESAEARLVIPVGILRIPVFSAPVALFHRNHDSCSAVTFSERHQETCLYGAYVESYIGYLFVRQKQSMIQFYGTLRWLLSTTITALPPPLLRHHCYAATTTATPIAVPPLQLPLLRCLSHCCATIAVAALPKQLLYHHCCCCAAIAIIVLPLSLLRHHLLCHQCIHCCATIAAPP